MKQRFNVSLCVLPMIHSFPDTVDPSGQHIGSATNLEVFFSKTKIYIFILNETESMYKIGRASNMCMCIESVRQCRPLYIVNVWLYLRYVQPVSVDTRALNDNIFHTLYIYVFIRQNKIV